MRTPLRWLALGVGLLPALALGASTDVVIAAGDCHDPDLVNVARELNDVLMPARGSHWLSPEQVSGKLSPLPTRSVEEIQRQYDAGLNAFYSGEYDRSDQLLRDAQEQIVRLPPSKSRVGLMASVNLARALVWLHNGKNALADEAFRSVLRLQPNYQLDPVYYSPDTRARFNRVRRELAHATKQRLSVKSVPSGAEVSLDGQVMGKTPLNMELPPGIYQLELSREGARSFPRAVDLKTGTDVVVDLSFEGSVDLTRVPCIRERPAKKDRLADAARLGGALGVDQAVVLHIEKAADGPSWLTASLLGLPEGQKIREGSLKIADPGRPPEGLSDLATFLRTGRVNGEVVTDRPEPVAAQAAPVAMKLAPKVDPAPPAVTERAPWPWRRKAGIGIAAGGAVAAIVGTVFEVSAASTWSEFDQHYAGGNAPLPADVKAVADLRDSARSKQTLGAAGLITGVAALGVGAYLYFTAPSGTSGIADHLTLGSGGGALAWDWP